MKANAYKERSYPVWNLLKELHAKGQLTPAQEFLCQPTMPEEELYDLDADPHQIRNLAKEPAYQQTRRRLSGVLERWIADTDDQGRFFEPAEVVKNEGRTKPAAAPGARSGRPGNR